MKNNFPRLKNKLGTNKTIPMVKSKGSSNRLKMISNIRLLIQNNLFPDKC